ncbi:MAG: DUF1592 domain-containing protein [Planctomycetota bacterium]|nr:DUF1592 domain-containing protein [Planctomycetota bacterium]
MGACRSLLLTLVLLCCALSNALAEDINYTSGYKAKLKPFLEKNCFRCHGEKVQKAKLRLDTAKFKPTDPDSYDFWQNVLDRVASGEMPPQKVKGARTVVAKPDPALKAEAEKISEWLTKALEQASAQASKAIRAKGKGTLRRLSRSQYANTVHQLLGSKASKLLINTFPEEFLDEGFDNIGSSQVMSDFLISHMIKTAEDAVEYTDYDQKTTTREELKEFAEQAFRRPVTDAQIAPYVRLADNTTGTRAYAAILCSPRFLYFYEDPGQLDSYALASRLSYYLWNSMPDKTLFKLAAADKLTDEDVFAGQVERMLKDKKADLFISNFLRQWLHLENITLLPPDEKKFKIFYDDALEDAFTTESFMVFKYMLEENRPVSEFLSANYTFINNDLAEHYGLDKVDKYDFKKVTLKDPRRGGLLTQGAVLTSTSNGVETSPVLRGIWVLQNILGLRKPKPPPNIPALAVDTRGTRTLRQQLSAHTKSSRCATCHRHIDPLGFALENFDAIGGWREKYENNARVDTSGKLPSGQKFRNIGEFKRALLARKDSFTQGLVSKFLTYATGRKMLGTDRSEIKKIAGQLKRKGYGLRDLILHTTASKIFLTR